MNKFLHVGIPLNISYKVDNSEKQIIFSWSQSCTAAVLDHYNITSNCGSCPTTTNHTNATCTDVPTEVDHCLFVIYGHLSLHTTTVDVELRGHIIKSIVYLKTRVFIMHAKYFQTMEVQAGHVSLGNLFLETFNHLC
jgi:hypothetical protein